MNMAGAATGAFVATMASVHVASFWTATQTLPLRRSDGSADPAAAPQSPAKGSGPAPPARVAAGKYPKALDKARLAAPVNAASLIDLVAFK